MGDVWWIVTEKDQTIIIKWSSEDDSVRGIIIGTSWINRIKIITRNIHQCYRIIPVYIYY